MSLPQIAIMKRDDENGCDQTSSLAFHMQTISPTVLCSWTVPYGGYTGLVLPPINMVYLPATGPP